jgi:hypothetical protein
MLPAESIRFFYLDPGWLAALLDGALSVGLGTSRDSTIQDQLRPGLLAMAQTAALTWRATALGLPKPAPLPAGAPTSGLLLRSALAENWPGLGLSASLQGVDVPVLRMDHLGAGVLLVLFHGVPDTVQFTEPYEGLAFGIGDAGELDPRSLAASRIINHPPLQVYDPANPAASTALRPGGRRVLNISAPPGSGAGIDLLGLLGHALGGASLGSANFALQMVRGPGHLTFTLSPPAKP